MRGKRVAAACLLAAASAFGQVASPDSSHPTTADLMLGRSSIRQGGRWESADLAITSRFPRTVGYIFLHEGDRPEGRGSFAAVAATHDWTSRFYTYTAAGGSLQRASFLPTSRIDLDLNAKLMKKKQLVATAGGTVARYPARRRDEVLSFGATYYAPLIVSYRFFSNSSFPGGVGSHAQLLQMAIEQPGRFSAFVRHSWGNEAYQLFNVVAPQNVSTSGHTTTLFVRRWMTIRAGASAEVEQQSKGSTFRRFGIRIGGFYSF